MTSLTSGTTVRKRKREQSPTPAQPIPQASVAEFESDKQREFLPHCVRGIKRGNIGIGVLPDDVTHDDKNNLVMLLSGYIDETSMKGEGYTGMTADTVRVNAFKAAIHGAIESQQCLNWFEIGPGADATLTRLVLEASTKTTLIGIEGNTVAASHAQRVLTKLKIDCNRYKIVSALSSDDSAHQIMQKMTSTCDAVLSEVLGMIMSAEYVVDIMSDVHKAGLLDNKRFLPRWSATFYTPVFVTRKHLKASLSVFKRSGVGVAVSPDRNWMHTRRFPLHDAAVFRNCHNKPVVGCLEFIDFAAPLNTQKVQKHTQTFSASSLSSSSSDVTGEAIIVHGFGLWVWAGFDCASTKQGKASSQTDFPYGWTSTEALKSPLPDTKDIKVSISSYLNDNGAYASNWRNVIMLFQTPITIGVGEILSVTSISDLSVPYQPTYTWNASVINVEGQIRLNTSTSMSQLYHMFEFDQVN